LLEWPSDRSELTTRRQSIHLMNKKV
jgi:hypothetical protein